MENLGGVIHDLVRPPADRLVAAYFDPGGPFAADTFDTLGRNEPFEVGADDLLACTTLDVAYPARAIRALLGSDREVMSELLVEVPPDVHLWAATYAHLDHAVRAWEFLDSYGAVGPVMAGKLLARKRPRLIPIVDSVVLAALGFPSNQVWRTLRSCLQDDGLRTAIEDLRPVGLSPAVTTLRLLDVAVWMRGSNSGNARRVRAEVIV